MKASRPMVVRWPLRSLEAIDRPPYILSETRHATIVMDPPRRPPWSSASRDR